ncbi:unnamed protein product [Moneuplotes crassus]|uniref:Uncharacterized protein n=1 Tax=Euplotes crassus TaxID=5936 RepID=A0AAD1XD55_EUPCR|nr:unnamed protein product [Moneuplotes crassus]
MNSSQSNNSCMNSQNRGSKTYLALQKYDPRKNRRDSSQLINFRKINNPPATTYQNNISAIYLEKYPALKTKKIALSNPLRCINLTDQQNNINFSVHNPQEIKSESVPVSRSLSFVSSRSETVQTLSTLDIPWSVPVAQSQFNSSPPSLSTEEFDAVTFDEEDVSQEEEAGKDLHVEDGKLTEEFWYEDDEEEILSGENEGEEDGFELSIEEQQAMKEVCEGENNRIDRCLWQMEGEKKETVLNDLDGCRIIVSQQYLLTQHLNNLEITKYKYLKFGEVKACLVEGTKYYTCLDTPTNT